jgi:hypothetical protein
LKLDRRAISAGLPAILGVPGVLAGDRGGAVGLFLKKFMKEALI